MHIKRNIFEMLTESTFSLFNNVKLRIQVYDT